MRKTNHTEQIVVVPFGSTTSTPTKPLAWEDTASSKQNLRDVLHTLRHEDAVARHADEERKIERVGGSVAGRPVMLHKHRFSS